MRLAAFVAQQPRVDPSGWYSLENELIISHKKEYLYHISRYFKMLGDEYSDVRVCERIIFDNSLYMLNNLNNKVESFTSMKTPQTRKREKGELLHPFNVLPPQFPKTSPLQQLSNDLTKPIVNIDHSQSSVLCRQPLGSKSLDYFNFFMLKFLQRFKNEHQDQGSMKLCINKINLEHQLRQENFRTLVVKNQQKIEDIVHRLAQLLDIFQQSFGKGNIVSSKQVFLNTILGSGQKKEQIGSFITLLEQKITSIVECESGPTFVNYWPQVEGLSFCIHPLLLAVYCTIKNQIEGIVKKQRQRNSNSNHENGFQNKTKGIFQSLGEYRCSKITFINLDHFESPFNLILAKYMHRYLQYISFPSESLSSISEHFVLDELTSSEIQKLCDAFNISEKSLKELSDIYKRLLVFPLRSSLMKPSLQLPDIEPYHSTFINFLMKEVVLNQIRQYNPSIVIISYSGQTHLKSSHFEQLLQQITRCLNSKILFYNNPTHNSSIFRDESVSVTSEHHLLQLGLKQDLLDKISAFLKVTSGTFSLDHFQDQLEESIQTFQNYKILKYTGKLLEYISKDHPTLLKLRNKFLEYPRREIAFTNYFKNNPPHPHIHTAYYLNCIEQAQLIIQQQTPEIIKNKFGENMKEHWTSFVDRVALYTSKMRERQTIKYITQLSPLNQSDSDLIALQFQLLDQPGIPVVLAPTSQVIHSKQRKGVNVPVLLLNHLPHKQSKTLKNYIGFIDESIENNCQRRVVLRQINFQQSQYQLTSYQNFCNFNFFETQQYILLFWPLLFDRKIQLLSQFSQSKYQPISTSLIFIAPKSNILNSTQISQQNKAVVNPRSGCTCYQPDHSSTIFIMGGYYNDLKNYFTMQTDLTCMQVVSPQQVLLENLPMSFFMNISQESQFGRCVVTGIHNDFIRPRKEYQICLKQKEGDRSSIILFGGVGQKYHRPYSILSHIGHLITFQQNLISGIKRIKLNSLVPTSLMKPVKKKSVGQFSVVRTAQNRKIGTSLAQLNSYSSSLISFEYSYLQHEERMSFSKKYEVGLRMYENEWEGNEFAHQNTSEPLVKIVQQRNFTFFLELDQEQCDKFVNLSGNLVQLTVQHIISIDGISSVIFALVYFPYYTEGKTILTYCESPSDLKEVTILQLKQIYCFQENLSHHSLRVMENGTIGIFKQEMSVPYIVIKRGRGGFYFRESQNI